MSYHLLTDELQEEIINSDDPGQWLIMSPHPESDVHYQVNCLDESFFLVFEDEIGPYRAVHEDETDLFVMLASNQGYRVAFEEMPIPADYDGRDPGLTISSTLEEADEFGFIPFQRREFNRLKNKDWGLGVWSTGTGKTVLAGALLKYHQENYDAALVVVKRHNKVNTQRKLERLVGLDPMVITGTKKQRMYTYDKIIKLLELGEKPIVVLNYEKFRDDFIWQEKYETKGGEERTRYHLTEVAEALFNEENSLLFIWDEMPMKLKNRSSHLYKSVCRCLYDGTPPSVSRSLYRLKNSWHYMTSATPVEHDPEDVFNCVRIMDQGRTFGAVTEFHKQYVKRFNFFNPHLPEKWHRLEHMHMKLAANTSRVDKTDPEIAAMFPKVIEEPRYIEWNKDHEMVYKSMTSWIEERLKDPEDETIVLASLNVLQMLCDMPSMLNESAANRVEFEKELAEAAEEGTEDEVAVRGAALALEAIEEFGELNDDKHGKLEELKLLLTERHPNEKTTLFTVYGKMLLPKLSERLSEWGVSHVVYAGTDKQRQAAQDAFMNDPSIQVFLSSDAGSDSIDLDIASVSIDYDFPWNWSRIIQRRNRGNRVTSTYETQYCYVLLMENSVEDRRVRRVAEKLGYHEGIFLGMSTDEVKSLRHDLGDLHYILLGSSE